MGVWGRNIGIGGGGWGGRLLPGRGLLRRCGDVLLSDEGHGEMEFLTLSIGMLGC